MIQTQIGAVFNIAGVILLSVIVPAAAVKRQSAAWVFTSFEPAAANDAGITNNL